MTTQTDTATVLFSVPLKYERLGDHVDEGLTTDHVIVRGRYTAVEFTLLGGTEAADDVDQPPSPSKAEPDSEEVLPSTALAAPGARAVAAAAAAAGATTAAVQELAVAPAPPPDLTPLLPPSLLPLAMLPPLLLSGLQGALAYFREVGRSHGRISSNPPQGRLRPLMAAADVVCQALQGDTSVLERAMAEARQPADEIEASMLMAGSWAEFAVDWCRLLASQRSSTFTEVSVGIAGIAAALVMCCCPTTAAAFMRAGGVPAAVGILALPLPSADMFRYASAVCEMLTVCQGAVGCEVLLGWWTPPPPPALPPPLELSTDALLGELGDDGRGAGGGDEDEDMLEAGASGAPGDGGTEDDGTAVFYQGSAGDDADYDLGDPEQLQEGQYGDEGDPDQAATLAMDDQRQAVAEDQQAEEDGAESYADLYGDVDGEDATAGNSHAGGTAIEAGRTSAPRAAGNDTRGSRDPDQVAERTACEGGGQRHAASADVAAAATGANRGGDAGAALRAKPSGRGSRKTQDERGPSQADGAKQLHHRSSGADEKLADVKEEAGVVRGSSTATEAAPEACHGSAADGAMPGVSGRDDGSAAAGGGGGSSRPRSTSRDRQRRRRHSSRSQSRSQSQSRTKRARSRSRSRSRSRDGRSSRRRRESPRSRSRSAMRRGGDSRRGAATAGERGAERDRSRERTSRHMLRPDERAGTTDASEPVSSPVVNVAALLTGLLIERARPAAIVAGSTRTLRRLHAYDAAVRLETAAARLIAGALPASDAAVGQPPQSIKPSQPAAEAVALARSAATALSTFSELLVTSMQLTQPVGKTAAAAALFNNVGVTTAIVTGGDQATLSAAADVKVAGALATSISGAALLPQPLQADSVLLQMLAPRNVLQAIAGALHAVSLQLGRNKDVKPNTDAFRHAQQLLHVQQQLVAGARALTAPLLSTPSGVRLLTSTFCKEGLAAIALALDPQPQPEAATASGKGATVKVEEVKDSKLGAAAKAPAQKGTGVAPGPLPSAVELAAALRHALDASMAVAALERNALDSSAAASAVETLSKAVLSGRASAAGRAATLQGLASSQPALMALTRLMRVKAHAYRAAGLLVAGAQARPRRHAVGLHLDEDEDEEENPAVYHPQALAAAPILLELVREPHASTVTAWRHVTVDIADASRSELEAMAAVVPAQQPRDEHRRWVLRELQGHADAVAQFQALGLVAGVLEPLDSELLPELATVSRSGAAGGEMAGAGLVGAAGGARRARQAKDVEPKRVLDLLRAPERSAQAAQLLWLLGTSLHPGCAHMLVLQAHAAGAQQVVERAVRCATVSLEAAAADSLWASQAGDALDTLERVRLRRGAVRFVCTATHAVLAFLQRLQQAARQPLANSGLLSALLQFHAALSLTPDSLHAAQGGAPTAAPSELLLARQQICVALSLWTDAGWRPALVGALFGTPLAGSSASTTPASGEEAAWADTLGLGLTGSAAPASTAAASGGAAAPEPHEAAACSQSPQEIFVALSVLGDLLPPEWPPAQQHSASRRPAAGAQPAPVAFPPPTLVSVRADVAKSIEQCSVQFRRMIGFGAGCESRMVRCATVRVASKAAGLGGGMGPFLAAPLLEQLQGIMKGSGPLSDARRVLEVLVPLAIRPAMKAALLDLKAVSLLGRFSHRLVTKLQEEQPEGLTVLSMCLDTLTMLCNPDLCLNPLATREQRLVDDMPAPSEAAAMVTALLACLPHLGAAAATTRALLAAPATGLASHVPGRAALRAGAHRWHTTQGPGSGAGGRAAATAGAGASLEPEALVTALAWAAGKLRESGERFKAGGGDPQGVGTACLDVSRVLEEVAASTAADAEEPRLPPPLPAPQRFLAAVDAARVAAAVAPLPPPHTADVAGPGWRTDALDVTPHAMVCDSITQSFWRYCKARPNRTALGRKLTKWDVGSDARPPPAAPSPVVVSYAQLLPDGLSIRKRPRDAKQPGGASAGSGIRAATVDGKRLRPEDEYEAGSANLPGPNDIPVIVAPRRRGDSGRVKFASSSRPASRHVDEYEGRRGAGPTPPPMSGALAATPPPLGLPPHLAGQIKSPPVLPAQPPPFVAPPPVPSPPVRHVKEEQTPQPPAAVSLAPSDVEADNLYENLYDAPKPQAVLPPQTIQPPSGAPLPQMKQPLPVAAAAPAQALKAASGTGSAPQAASGEAAVAVPANQQQLMAVLRDPVKLKKLLETHPHLVGMLKQQLAPK